MHRHLYLTVDRQERGERWGGTTGGLLTVDGVVEGGAGGLEVRCLSWWLS